MIHHRKYRVKSFAIASPFGAANRCSIDHKNACIFIKFFFAQLILQEASISQKFNHFHFNHIPFGFSRLHSILGMIWQLHYRLSGVWLCAGFQRYHSDGCNIGIKIIGCILLKLDLDFVLAINFAFCNNQKTQFFQNQTCNLCENILPGLCISLSWHLLEQTGNWHFVHLSVSTFFSLPKQATQTGLEPATGATMTGFSTKTVSPGLISLEAKMHLPPWGLCTRTKGAHLDRCRCREWCLVQ